MRKLKALGLRVQKGTPTKRGEKRLSVYTAKTNMFVAWFQSNVETRAGVRVASTNTSLVCHSELTRKQLVAVKKWLSEQIIATL